ncbi:MAG TPA: fumarylacetoacetate hydrolase family protein [Acidimicrobiales bacterium]|nr:fumarylacetoacetate hydrolase family protein [Acidimicrobiales bacterium]
MTDAGSGFGGRNLPYGVLADGHVVVAYGEAAIDLAHLGGFDVGKDVFASGSLNAFMSLGPDAWARTRSELSARLDALPASSLRDRSELDLVLPFDVADYVDFYASIEHACAMGRLLRPDGDPLPAAFRYLPMGYHGRAATIIASGAAIPRPSGLVRDGEGCVQYRRSARLDVEVELGFVVGVGSPRSRPISATDAHRHVFGLVLLNDWSARDIQALEYQPLGPFLGKSFATSISPWVVPLAAVAPFAVEGPPQDPPPASHLVAHEPRNFDIALSLELNGTVIATTNARHLYWSMAQQLAHLTSNGAATRTGDLFASGTISGRDARSAGSLMELTSSGRDPIELDDGSTRSWLDDGDEVVIRGWAGPTGDGERISLGEVRGRVVANADEEVEP